MSNTNNCTNYKRNLGFDNIDKSKSPYEQIREGIVNEMINRKTDCNPNNPLDFYKTSKTNGEWDFKPIMKTIVPKYESKKAKIIDKVTGQSKPATIFAMEIPMHDGYLCDYDVLGNIHFGYAGRINNVPEWMLIKGSEWNDRWNNGTKDPKDTKAVRIGSELYDEIGPEPTKEKLSQAIDDKILYNLSNLNYYKKEELIPKVSNPLTRDVSTWSEDDIKDVMRMPEYKYDKGINNKVRDYFEKRYPEKIISGGGDVHVSGYTRMDDGKSVSVSDYYRSRPNR